MVTENQTLTHFQQPTVSSSSVLDLLDFCDTANIAHNESPLLVREDLLNPESRVQETQLIALWHEIVKQTDIPAVGLMIGQQINPSAKGLLASWVSQCETLGEALSVFQQHISLMNPSEQWHMSRHAQHTQLVFTLEQGKGYPVAAIERSMSALLSWGRELTRENIKPLTVSFSHHSPEYRSQYEKVFGENISFDQTEYSFLFENQVLELPIRSANMLLKKMIEVKAQENLEAVNNGVLLSKQLSGLIEENLTSQKITVEHFSTLLNMSRQTLYRRLKQEDTDFKTLLNDVRKDKVAELLTSEKVNMLHVSLQLGFKETSSFYKAFQRWYGMTPTEYLNRQKTQ